MSETVTLSVQGDASASPFAVMESQTVMIFLMKTTVKALTREKTSVPPCCQSLVLIVALRGKYCIAPIAVTAIIHLFPLDLCHIIT